MRMMGWLVIFLTLAAAVTCHAAEGELLRAPFEAAAGPKSSDKFEVVGDARLGPLGNANLESSGRGVRLFSANDLNGDGQRSGALACTLKGIRPEMGRWYRLHIRGLAQEGFAVKQELLYLKVEFFKDQGRDSLDMVRKTVYAQVEQDRRDLADAGTNRQLGAATWRHFSLEFRTPFPEVDTLRLSAEFEQGAGRGPYAEFWINEFDVAAIPEPADYAPRRSSSSPLTDAALGRLVPLGGRWYYDPRSGDRQPPSQFDAANADRLVYRSARLETPFAGNTTAWLRSGWLDMAGKPVGRDRYVPDNVTIRVTPSHLVIRSHNLPNHPTATFPDRWRALDGNPNYIQEKDLTHYIPLEPRENPQHVAMDPANSNRALPGGAIGVAVNGVIFFNPFDHIANGDAVWRLDRCCGHPNPMWEYHYHKYPVCVKSPWTDDGADHSPVIGFAFDGFAVYGPYEAAGQLAKDGRDNRLNEFNGHSDPERGWHYHVTPGKFPHILGGYWGTLDPRNRRGPPGGPGRMPPGGGPFPFPPPFR
jgi:hypothetical protein